MGKLLMENIFKPENRLVSTLSPEARKERRFYLILSFLIFAISAYPIWQFLYIFCDLIGSIVSGSPNVAIKDAIRMMPQIISSIGLVHMGVYAHCAYRATSAKKRISAWKINGLISLTLGVCNILYVVIGKNTGIYYAFIETSANILYPLNMIFGGIVLIAYGYFAYFYGKRLESKGSNLPFYNDKRNGHLRRFDHVFYTIGYLVFLCSASACVLCFYVLDLNNYIFFNIMVFITYFVAVVQAFFYRYAYIELKEGIREKITFKAALIALVVNFVLFAIYMITLQCCNEAPDQNATAVMPIDFAASVNAFMAVFLLNNVVAPLAALIKGVCINKKLKTTKNN